MNKTSAFFVGHVRLLVALAVGVLTALLPLDWGSGVSRALAGWNAGVYAYLAIMAWSMARANASHIRRVAEQQDETAYFVLAVMSVAAVMSFLAIFVELAQAPVGGGAPGGTQVGAWGWLDAAAHVSLTVATVLGTWLLVPTMFAAHYAHLYYLADEGARPLGFPDEPEEPRYVDFLYFSFTVGMTSQTSDVVLRSSTMRRDVLLQSMLAYFFNAGVLALTINVAASLLRP